MNRKKILFVCIHNSARVSNGRSFSEYTRCWSIWSGKCGLLKGTLELAVEAMSEIRVIFLKTKRKRFWFFYKEGKLYTCHHCMRWSQRWAGPVFPGIAKQLHWSFLIPRNSGYERRKLQQVRVVRDEIRKEDRRLLLLNLFDLLRILQKVKSDIFFRSDTFCLFPPPYRPPLRGAQCGRAGLHGSAGFTFDYILSDEQTSLHYSSSSLPFLCRQNHVWKKSAGPVTRMGLSLHLLTMVDL